MYAKPRHECIFHTWPFFFTLSLSFYFLLFSAFLFESVLCIFANSNIHSRGWMFAWMWCNMTLRLCKIEYRGVRFSSLYLSLAPSLPSSISFTWVWKKNSRGTFAHIKIWCWCNTPAGEKCAGILTDVYPIFAIQPLLVWIFMKFVLISWGHRSFITADCNIAIRLLYSSLDNNGWIHKCNRSIICFNATVHTLSLAAKMIFHWTFAS